MKYFLIIGTLFNSIYFLTSDNQTTPQTTAKKYTDSECPNTIPTEVDSQGIVTQAREVALRRQAELQRLFQEREAALRRQEELRRSFVETYGLPPRLPFENQS